MTEFALIIFFICVAGCGYTSFKLGFKQGVRIGAANTVDALHEHKIIRFDHKGEIKPYNK